MFVTVSRENDVCTSKPNSQEAQRFGESLCPTASEGETSSPTGLCCPSLDCTKDIHKSPEETM